MSASKFANSNKSRVIDKRTKLTGKAAKTSSFTMLIHAYFQSPEYAELSPRAVKLLVDIACQYRGNNNGDLCATLSVMKKAGWTSNDQLQKGLAELIAKGWIILARQGGRRSPNLYGLTFFGINPTGKLDAHIKPSKAPLNLWKFSNRHEISLSCSVDRIWQKLQATSSGKPHAAILAKSRAPVSRQGTIH